MIVWAVSYTHLVPASTREKHRTRYEAFCRKLSAEMGVADGYGAITVAYDREMCIRDRSKESLFCLILKLKEMSVDAVKQELLAKLKEEHF